MLLGQRLLVEEHLCLAGLELRNAPGLSLSVGMSCSAWIHRISGVVPSGGVA